MSVLVADGPVERIATSTLDRSWWAGGLTLAERCALPSPPGAPVSPEALARGKSRLARWREMYWFGGLDEVLQTLSGTEVNETTMLALLAEGPGQLAARAAMPQWARCAEAVLALSPMDPALPDPPDGDGAAGYAGLRTIIAPFVGLAVEQLSNAGDLDPLRESLIADLERTLVGLAARTLALELNARRALGRLSGGTPRERYWSFVKHFAGAAGLTALLGEYPVLARLLVEAADRAASGWARFLRRLAADRALIVRTMFDGVDPGRLVRAADAGHCMTLTFASGVRLAYRDWPVGACGRLGEAVTWLNTAMPGLGLHVATVLDRGMYGWLAHVEPRPGDDPAAGQRLNYRWGALLALLHSLGGADLDDGDLVACGDQPVLVRVARAQRLPSVVDTDPAQLALDTSVRRLGVLPAAPQADAGDADRLPGNPALRWAAPGTDEMRVVRADRARRPSPLIDSLLAGFSEAYDVITARQGELTELQTRYARAAGQVRIRSTGAYATLLSESTHPDVLRDALDRDRLLGLLSGSGELAELRAGAIPPPAGQIGVAGRHPGPEPVPGLGPKDRLAQEWILRAWLAERRPPGAGTGSRPAERRPPRAHGIDPQRCVTQARAIAEHLGETAYRLGPRVAWLGLTTLDEQSWLVRPLGPGLYDGYPGVALFLAKLAELTGEARYADLARDALAHVPAMLGDLRGQPVVEAVRCGPFTGFTGLAYGLVHVAASLADPALLDAALPPIYAAAMAASNDNEPGVLGGQAGGAAAMLALDAALGSPAARRVATGCVQRIVDRMEPGHASGAWGSALAAATRPPAGFAHGASGIGWALTRYAAATGDTQSADAGLVAMRYERELGLPIGGGWCRGVAGIGLARAEAAQAGVAADFEAAVRAVASADPLGDHSLCHGELGCLELLMAAARLGNTGAAAALDRRAALLLDDVERHGPRCGTPGQVPTPGLLTGLAGVGYGLLRLAFPDQAPAVLLLDPPPQGSLPAYRSKGDRR